MGTYFLRRLRLALVTVIGVSIIVFVATRLSGDVVLLLLPQDATQAEIARFRGELGLDRPYVVQYARFAWGVLHGDFGESIRYRQPAMELVLSRLPATLQLAFSSFVIATVAGVMLGVAAARRRGSWLDLAARMVSIGGQSMPNFWVGIMAILVFAVSLGWLPTSGREGLSYMILPTLTLALAPIASVLRITRSAMLETLESESVKFLRVKGAPEWLIVWKHALRNALIPVVALSGLQLGFLIGGTVIVETVFAWPGLGNLLVEAIATRDYPIVEAGVAVISVFLILLNLAVDLLFGVIDPRVRFT